MTLDGSGLAIAEQATHALGSLERYGHVLRPAGTDEVAWRLEVLDELARAGRRLAGAVGRVAGDEDAAVVAMVHELSSAIDLHTDRVIREIRERPRARGRRGVSRPDGVVAFPTPYPRAHDDVPRPTGSLAPAARPAADPVVDPSVQRAVIGTAAELLMTRHGYGVDAAYALILERARDSGASTYQVAARVVDER